MKLLLLLLALSPRPAHAYTEIIDYFIDSGIAALGRGGMEKLPRGQESLDFGSPLFLDSHGRFRSDTCYEYARTVRIFSGSWAGSHAYGERLDSAIAAPYSLLDGNVTGSLAAGYGYRWFDVQASSREDDIDLRSNENLAARKGGVYLNAFDRLKIGISFISTDFRKSLELPIEAEYAPADFLKVGYKRSYIDIAADLSVRLSGRNGAVPVRYGEEIHELYAVVDYRGIIYGKYANEIDKPADYRAEGRISLPWSLYLIGNISRREAKFREDLLVGNAPAGYMKGQIAGRGYRAGVGGKIGERWNLEFNYRHKELASRGGGIAKSSAIVSFWPSLLIGNYNHLENTSFRTDQYHLGAEYKGSNWLLAGGVQYIDLKPTADLEYWRNVIFGIGRTGAGTLSLETDRVQLLFISLGLGYQWKNVTINYALGQFIPLDTHSRKQNEPAGGGGGTPGGGGDSDIFSDIADKISRNPGGNIQRIFLTLTF